LTAMSKCGKFMQFLLAVKKAWSVFSKFMLCVKGRLWA